MFFISKIEAERINQEKRLVEFVGYIYIYIHHPSGQPTVRSVMLFDVVDIFVFLHASHLNF